MRPAFAGAPRLAAIRSTAMPTNSEPTNEQTAKAADDPQPHMPSRAAIERYLTDVLGEPVRCTGATLLGVSSESDEEKPYGYGVPVKIDFTVAGKERSAVLHTMSPNAFGHELMADRAAILLWSRDAFNTLPRHVRSLSVGAFDKAGAMHALDDADEFFLLTDFAEGNVYADDLRRIRESGDLSPGDRDRADALCDYLLEIHAIAGPQPSLYTRRIRQLVGHGECIMGLIDSYPRDHPWITAERLQRIEQRVVEWRWRLKDRTHRLRRTHGDFHPWNILFGDGTDLRVLDHSRGEWGEPADDVTSLTLNYVFESLRQHGKLEGAFKDLFDGFWQRYLTSGDDEVLEAAPPFVAWRGLVMASPVWYPDLNDAVRRKLFSLIESVLESPRFEPAKVNESLAAGM